MNKPVFNLFILGFLSLTILILSIFVTKSQHPQSQASPSFIPWNFAVISDSHNLDQNINQTVFSQIQSQNPDILFHVGDLGFNQYISKIGDYRYYPLKGILDILYRGQFPQPPSNPAEVHVALGNHDVANQPRPKKILESTYKNICLGQQAYWDPVDQDPCYHHSQPQSDPVWQSGYLSFNPEIIKNNFCQDNSTNYNYTFSRGNIRFILLGHIYTDNRQAQKDWFVSQVCQPNDSSVSIAFIHELEDFADEFLTSLTCPHNLKLVIGGHVHLYSYRLVNNIPALTMAGMAVSGQPDSCTPHLYPENDYLIFNVNQTYLSLNRIIWPNGQAYPNSAVNILTIPGSFSSYSYPGAVTTPTSAPTKIPTSIPSITQAPVTQIPLTSTPSPLETLAPVKVSLDISFAGIKPSTSTCFINPSVEVVLVSDVANSDRPQFIDITKTNKTNRRGETIYNLAFETTKFNYGEYLSIFIKGPAHLMTKYGQDNQTDFYNQATSQIKFQLGKTLNLADYPIFPGDVNGDAKINGLDFSQIKTSASSFSTTDSNSDLDGSCQVNNFDLSLLVKTLSIKFEQVY